MKQVKKVGKIAIFGLVCLMISVALMGNAQAQTIEITKIIHVYVSDGKGSGEIKTITIQIGGELSDYLRMIGLEW